MHFYERNYITGASNHVKRNGKIYRGRAATRRIEDSTGRVPGNRKGYIILGTFRQGILDKAASCPFGIAILGEYACDLGFRQLIRQAVGAEQKDIPVGQGS